MRYISTRGEIAPLSFTDAGLSGLATDGGLLIPESLPNLAGDLERLSTLTYADLAQEIFSRFIDDIPSHVLRDLVKRAYAPFRHPDIAPVVRVGNRYILELFHGPTLAFKDMAMRFLAQFFEHALAERGETLNILGSTSGDTGSAAIHSVRGMSRVRILMMHPDGRTSPLQALQMTSVLDPNVFNLAIEGSFDDCQRIMKTLFADVPFKEAYHLGAVNSVNWIRVMAQIAYYFYAGLRVLRESGASAIQFAVPTGNFGNILAGYYAARMGLPVSRLILATNENDILARFFRTGVYASGRVAHTISPSMDIQVASNFERLLHALFDGDPAAVRDAIGRFAREGSVDLSARRDHPAMALFCADRADTARTLRTIRAVHADTGYILDPHTAVGVAVGDSLRDANPLICLATAHAAKFPAALKEAIGIEPTHPILEALKGAPTRCDKLPADVERVRDYIVRALSN